MNNYFDHLIEQVEAGIAENTRYQQEAINTGKRIRKVWIIYSWVHAVAALVFCGMMVFDWMWIITVGVCAFWAWFGFKCSKQAMPSAQKWVDQYKETRKEWDRMLVDLQEKQREWRGY